MSKNPRTVTCAICGRKFMTSQPTAYTCSPECRAERKRRRMRGRPHSYGEDCECEMCGAIYTPRHKDQRTCGRECGQWIRHDYIGKTCERLHGQSSLLHHRHCTVATHCRRCGADIRDGLPSHRKARMCANCYNADQRERDWRSGKVRARRTCVVCGRNYHKRDGNNITCSDECRRVRERRHKSSNHRQRARRFGCYYEPVDKRKVFERDHWTCHICGKPIPWGTALCAPLSPTLDHVWPMSKGGPHSYENVKAAHFICNSIKSDSIYPQGHTHHGAA